MEGGIDGALELARKGFFGSAGGNDALSSWLQLPQTSTLHLIFAAIVVIGFSHLKDQVELLVRLLDQVERIKGQLSDTKDTLRDFSKCADNIRDQSRRVDRLLGHPIDLQDH